MGNGRSVTGVDATCSTPTGEDLLRRVPSSSLWHRIDPEMVGQGTESEVSRNSRELRLNEAFVKLADTLTDDYDIMDLLQTLIGSCIDLLDVQAAGLMLAEPTGGVEVVPSTSEEAEFVDVMQRRAESGPCVDCFTTGTAAAVTDIDELGRRWPEFRAAALLKGYRSMHAIPPPGAG